MADDMHTGGGVAAQHDAPPASLFRVAPTDGGKSFNALRIPLVAVACWRLNNPAFAFDSSFVGSDSGEQIAKLAALVAANRGCPASVFGHADPAGSDDVNKVISDRRTIAVYAMLTRNIDAWEDLYAKPVDGDTWGASAIQTILATLSDRNGDPYYTLSVDGDYGDGTKDAVKRFQSDAGLAVDGTAGPLTRKALFGAYMDQLCTDDSGTRFLMKPEDFLGGGADPGGKMAMQGCSRFNPVVLLPGGEEDDTSGSRNADNAPNRRVLIFLFRPRKIDPSEWPCPRVKETADACRAQFWPDGDARRKNGDSVRRYEVSRDTMACRFYERFARRSPCEGKGLPPGITDYPFST
jgi:Putative peptidoglycan binding domain